MQNKKNLILGAIFIAVVFFIGFYFFQVKKIFNNDSWLAGNKEEKLETEKIKCEFSMDSEIYTKISENGNKDYCQCLSDKAKIPSCLGYAGDTSNFQKALSSYKIENCDLIENYDVKASCMEAVKQGLLDLEKQKKDNPTAEVLTPELVKLKNENPDYISKSLKLVSDNIAFYEINPGFKSDEDVMNNIYVIMADLKKYNPNNAEIYRIDGDLNFLNNQKNESLESYTKSIELDFNNLNTHIGRAKVYIDMDNVDSAIADLEKARELDRDKKETSIYFYLCDLYAKGANKDKARENCEIAIAKTESEDKIQSQRTLESLK